LVAYQKIESTRILSASQNPTTSSASLLTSHTHIRFGVALDDYANRHGSLSSLEEELNQPIAIVSIFKQFGQPGNTDLNQADLAYIKSRGKTLLLAWEPWKPEDGMHQSVDYLNEIASGNEDAYLQRFAQEIQTYHAPVIIRFGHEMNGDWYPWGQRPEEYITAYRHIVSLFRQERIANVTWMWSVNANPLKDLDRYYPGDEFVDEIGIDGFNFGTTNGGHWQTFRTLFAGAYLAVMQYGKPINISEVASAEEGGDKALWVKNMLKDDLPNQFPKLKSIVWFTILKEADWRIDSSRTTFTAFQTSL
jgi:beta-mannanase